MSRESVKTIILPGFCCCIRRAFVELPSSTLVPTCWSSAQQPREESSVRIPAHHISSSTLGAVHVVVCNKLVVHINTDSIIHGYGVYVWCIDIFFDLLHPRSTSSALLDVSGALLCFEIWTWYYPLLILYRVSRIVYRVVYRV